MSVRSSFLIGAFGLCLFVFFGQLGAMVFWPDPGGICATDQVNARYSPQC